MFQPKSLSCTVLWFSGFSAGDWKKSLTISNLQLDLRQACALIPAHTRVNPVASLHSGSNVLTLCVLEDQSSGFHTSCHTFLFTEALYWRGWSPALLSVLASCVQQPYKWLFTILTVVFCAHKCSILLFSSNRFRLYVVSKHRKCHSRKPFDENTVKYFLQTVIVLLLLH